METKSRVMDFFDCSLERSSGHSSALNADIRGTLERPFERGRRLLLCRHLFAVSVDLQDDVGKPEKNNQIKPNRSGLGETDRTCARAGIPRCSCCAIGPEGSRFGGTRTAGALTSSSSERAAFQSETRCVRVHFHVNLLYVTA